MAQPLRLVIVPCILPGILAGAVFALDVKTKMWLQSSDHARCGRLTPLSGGDLQPWR